MRGITTGVTASACIVLAACTGPSTVEVAVRDAFVDCMAEQGIAVEDVEVEVVDGRHIEAFSWQAGQDGAAEEAGRECEDTALRRFRVSRS